MSKARAPRTIEAEDEDGDENFEEQQQKRLAAQRVAASGKRPRSLAADAPVDDEDDDDDDDDEFRDEYVFAVPGDPGLYKDADDYNRMQALSELDREMELSERMDIRQRSLDQWERRREIAAEKRRQQRLAAGAASKKARGTARGARAAEAAEAAEAASLAAPVEPANEPPAERPLDARQQLLAEMREAREKRAEAAAAEKLPAQKGRRPGRKASSMEEGELEDDELARAPTTAADADADEEDDDGVGERARENDDADRARAHERAGAGRRVRTDETGVLDGDDEPAPPEQLERIRLTRARLAAWVEEPFFEQAVVGCFVRVSIGSHGGEPVYRVAEVVDVTTSSAPYELIGGPKPARTTKKLLLEIAGVRRPFQISFVSNANFTPDELRRYKRAMEDKLLPRRSRRQVEAKVAQLLHAKQHVYTEQDIASMVQKNLQEKKVIGRGALRKAELLALREAALEHGGEESVAELARIDGLLADLEALADENRRALETAAAPPSTLANSISAINQRNRKMERAGADTVAARREEEEEDVNNPFARRETRPTMYWHMSAPNKKPGDADPTAAAAGVAAATAVAAGTGGAGATAAPPAAGRAGALTIDANAAAPHDSGATAGRGTEPTTPSFAQLMRQHTGDDLSVDAARARSALASDGAGADALPAIVAAHMPALEIELIDAKSAGAGGKQGAAAAVHAKLSEAAVRSYAAWLSVAHQPVSAATMRMSLHNYFKRRNGAAA